MARAKLDRIDRRILSDLQSNGRMTNVDLAERAGISAPPCLRRVRALERAGIIKGYHAELSPEALGDFVKPWKINGAYQPYKPVGCVDCRMGGYRGRMGLYELLTVSEALKDRITQSPSIANLRRQAVQDGMRPLRLGGAVRVAEGQTTLDEVLACTPPVN